MTAKESTIDYLSARIRALESENKRLTKLIEQRQKNSHGFMTDINDKVFHKPIKDSYIQ